MYTGTKVKSGLVTGTMWDTTLKWIQNSGKSVTDSRTWGNYSDSLAPANLYKGQVFTAGYCSYWKAKNIYDLAGNLWEWTNEKVNPSYFIFRGGVYGISGSTKPASCRSNDGYHIDFLTFRVALYLI